MQVFSRILCPVDFSRYSVTALEYATALARDSEAQLLVYHSVPDLSQAISYIEGNYIETVHESLKSSARMKLEEFISSIGADRVKPSLHIGAGNPSDEILRVAKEHGVDLIVMGTHGYTGPERFFLGSVTNKVLHKSVVPVMVVCQPSHHFIRRNGDPSVQIKRILCPVDLEPNNSRLRDLALSIAKKHQAEITFLHIIPKRENVDYTQSTQHLRSLIRSEEDNSLVRYQVASGEPAQEILNRIESNEVDLVVMGHHTRRPIEELFLGSVAKRVVVDSRCPVLVMRSRSEVIYP